MIQLRPLRYRWDILFYMGMMFACLLLNGFFSPTCSLGWTLVWMALQGGSAFWVAHCSIRKHQHRLFEENKRLEHSRQILLQEQLSAKRIFDNIVHTGCLSREGIRYRLSPHSIFNGDVLLAQEKPNGAIVFFLGDLTGHGLPAAIGILPCSEIFYTMVGKGFFIEQIICEINKKLQDVLPEGLFCSGLMFEIDFETRTIKCWNGGIPEPILFNQHASIQRVFESKNLPLGFFDSADFKPDFEYASFEEGDRLLFFSDGILESTNERGEWFGKQRIRDIFDDRTDAGVIFEALLNKVSDFQADHKTNEPDDITICEFQLKKTSSGIPIGGEVLTRRIPELDWGFHLELPVFALKTMEPVPILIHTLIEYPALLHHKEKLFLILSELYSNALEHGVLGLNSILKSEENGFTRFYEEKANRLDRLTEGWIRIHVQLKPCPDGGEVWITVRDSGPGFDQGSSFSELKQNPHPNGRGIALVNHLCECLEYTEEGACATACYRWFFQN